MALARAPGHGGVGTQPRDVATAARACGLPGPASGQRCVPQPGPGPGPGPNSRVGDLFGAVVDDTSIPEI